MQETDQSSDEEEQRLGTALSSFMKALDVAEEKLSRVSYIAKIIYLYVCVRAVVS